MIDTSLVSVTDNGLKRQGYSLSTKSCDIKSYFPTSLDKAPFLIQGGDNMLSFSPASTGGKLTKETFTDLIGREHDSVLYQASGNPKLEYIPTAAGIMVNITLSEKPVSNQIVFYIDKQAEIDYVLADDQYLVLKEGNMPKAVISTSFLRDNSGAVSFANGISLVTEGDKWKYTITLDEDFLNDPNTSYPLTITPTFELYRSNMNDATLYENMPDSNLHLADYAVLGNNDFFGESLHYLSYRINYLVKSYEQNVISAAYVAPVLANTTANMPVEMLLLKNMWNSSGITWNSKYDTYGRESLTNINQPGRYSFGTTNFVKACIKDDTWVTEVYGLAMASDTVGMAVIATNDNTFYQPYIRIDFYDLPWTFEKIEEINPNQDF